MISYLANATGFNETQFQHPDLPDAWSWGFSGMVSSIFEFTLSERLLTVSHSLRDLSTIQQYFQRYIMLSRLSSVVYHPRSRGKSSQRLEAARHR
jgi:hypothetical protein